MKATAAPVAYSVPFDPDGLPTTQDNVQEVIAEIITKLGHDTLVLGYRIVPEKAQLYAYGTIEVEGTLDLLGELHLEGAPQEIVIPPTPDDNFSHRKIPVGKVIVIPINQQMIVDCGIEVLGTLEVDGDLSILGADIGAEFHPSFSFDYVAIYMAIPLYQQMIVHDAIDVHGSLDILGSLIII